MPAQSSQQHQQGEVVLLFAGALFAPFTLLTCLTLYKLARCRGTKDEDDVGVDEAEEPGVSGRKWTTVRQAVLLIWLTAAAAFAAAGGSYDRLGDFQLTAAPGDQRVMSLGGWAGVCGAVSLTLEDGEAPLGAQVFYPGPVRRNWRAEPFKRGVFAAGTVGGAWKAAWELPAAGRRRPANLTVGANFRHRLRLWLLRRHGAEGLAEEEQQDEEARSLGYGNVELVDTVQGINSLTVYNVTLPGRLTVHLINLDDMGAATSRDANFSFSVGLAGWRFAPDGPQWGRVDCRLGQGPCELDNPAAWLVLQLPTATGVEATAVAAAAGTPAARRLTVRCERQSVAAKAAPAILAAAACLPCALVLTASALLDARCRRCGKSEPGQPHHHHHHHHQQDDQHQQREDHRAADSASGGVVGGKGGRRAGKLGVRFKLQDEVPECPAEKP